MEIYESEREQRLKYLSLSGFSQAFLQIDGQLTVDKNCFDFISPPAFLKTFNYCVKKALYRRHLKSISVASLKALNRRSD